MAISPRFRALILIEHGDEAPRSDAPDASTTRPFLKASRMPSTSRVVDRRKV